MSSATRKAGPTKLGFTETVPESWTTQKAGMVAKIFTKKAGLSEIDLESWTTNEAGCRIYTLKAGLLEIGEACSPQEAGCPIKLPFQAPKAGFNYMSFHYFAGFHGKTIPVIRVCDFTDFLVAETFLY